MKLYRSYRCISSLVIAGIQYIALVDTDRCIGQSVFDVDYVTHEASARRFLAITGTQQALEGNTAGAWEQWWSTQARVRTEVVVDASNQTIQYRNGLYQEMDYLQLRFTEIRKVPQSFPLPPESRTAEIAIDIRFADSVFSSPVRPVTWDGALGSYAFEGLTPQQLGVDGSWQIHVTGTGVDEIANGTFAAALDLPPGYLAASVHQADLWNHIATDAFPSSITLSLENGGDTYDSSWYWNRFSSASGLPVSFLQTVVGGVAFDFGIWSASRFDDFGLAEGIAVPEPRHWSVAIALGLVVVPLCWRAKGPRQSKTSER